MSLRQKAVELSKNQKAVAGLIKIIAFLVISGVVLYCDIQFIQVMWKTYPDGAAKVFSLIGAVATGASVLALIAAEAYWFSRGPQMLFGWIFTGVEAAISAANVILSFELTGGIEKLDQFMAAYLWLCPATPVVAAICWIIIFNLDDGQKARHDHREMQDDIAESNREHAKAVHASQMQLNKRYLESTTQYLDQIADDPRIQAGLQAGAWKFATEQLRQITGVAMSSQMPQLPPGGAQAPIVDANPPSTPPAEKKSEEKSDAPVAPPSFPTVQEIAAALADIVKPLPAPSAPPTAETSVRITPPKAAPAPVQPPEQEYVVRRPEPVTETLAPFTVAPSGKTNGNGANHPKPMPQ